jgi:hypothetical protein
VDFKCSLLENNRGQALPIDDFKSLTYFRKCLADLSTIAYENKEDNYLISPSIFDPETGCRRSIDHQESYFLVLDIDDGEMLPEDVERIFRTREHTQVFDIALLYRLWNF